jgi:ATP-binding cassette subfamily B protein
LLIYATAVFIILNIISTISRLSLTWWISTLTHRIAAELARQLYENIINMQYSEFSRHNTSEYISTITTKNNMLLYDGILPFITMISSMIIATGIALFLIAINPVAMTIMFCVLVLAYAAIIIIVRNKVKIVAKNINHKSERVIQIIQEGLGNIRDIIINRYQQNYIKEFYLVEETLRKSQSMGHIIGITPRYVVEGIGYIALVLMAYVTVGNGETAIPIIGLIALGLQRLLPLIQQIYFSWSRLSVSSDAIRSVVRILAKRVSQIPGYQDKVDEIHFKDAIELIDISYKYKSGSKEVLNSVSFKINKGDVLGIIGETGSGKSTLVDLIAGLLFTTNGTISVDGIAITKENSHRWQKSISYVSQIVCMTNKSIGDNISFQRALKSNDHEKIVEAAKKAQLHSTISQMKNGYNTFIGEQGALLSGGQRQRVGIARAIYKSGDVLILDEATSALDGKTEDKIATMIQNYSRERTVLIITHRPALLECCTRIIEISNGKIVEHDGPRKQ